MPSMHGRRRDISSSSLIRVFYAYTPARFGVINPDVNDQAAGD